ncbi:hypothetical protein V7S43_017998 [Phytophthora oleae]|uniref:Uncharacterized protein n=1 Tax=Phytophthora oleae TaxID=2107226 RepID=A0ABD3EVM7_9STRA
MVDIRSRELELAARVADEADESAAIEEVGRGNHWTRAWIATEQRARRSHQRQRSAACLEEAYRRTGMPMGAVSDGCGASSSALSSFPDVDLNDTGSDSTHTAVPGTASTVEGEGATYKTDLHNIQ